MVLLRGGGIWWLLRRAVFLLLLLLLVGWLVWLVGAAVRWFVRMEVANHCRKKKNKKQKQKTQKEEESGKEGGVAKGACAPEFGVGFEQAGCCCILWCWISFPKKEGACEDVREISAQTSSNNTKTQAMADLDDDKPVGPTPMSSGLEGLVQPEDQDYVPYVPVKQRRQQQIERRMAKRRHQQAQEDEKRRKEEKKEEPIVGPYAKQSLVAVHGKSMQEGRIVEQSDFEKQLAQEDEIMRSIRNAKELKSVEELAKGIHYVEPIKTSWRAPHYIRGLTREQVDRIRKKRNILVEGRDPPPPIKHFRDMKIPTSLVDYLEGQGIKTPTPIQMQGTVTVQKRSGGRGREEGVGREGERER